MHVRPYISIFAVIATVILSNLPAQAHHSIANFWYESRSIEITGVVKELKLVNLHSQIMVEVTESNGQKTMWTAVGASRTAMVRAGWSDKTLLGTKVTIEGAPPRNEGTKGIFA